MRGERADREKSRELKGLRARPRQREHRGRRERRERSRVQSLSIHPSYFRLQSRVGTAGGHFARAVEGERGRTFPPRGTIFTFSDVARALSGAVGGKKDSREGERGMGIPSWETDRYIPASARPREGKA